MNDRRRLLWPGAVAGIAVLLAGACSGDAGAGECVRVVDEDTGETGKECLPLAPRGDRVDLAEPVFTHPTRITNPLHPTALVDQVIMGGQTDGEVFRTEVSVLPGSKTITWDGTSVSALTSQYAAYSDGRIHEVALDWYAQADDGSVWYLGEDVFNYEDGVVENTDGTWQAGRDRAPAAMIMPSDPAEGDVYRPENQPGVVFEEVTVKAVDRTVQGPYGEVDGAITVTEVHMDGSTEEKVFAPGYGEFSTGTEGGDLEAVSLAVPTDAAPDRAVPAELTALDRAARAAQDGAVTDGDARAVRSAWRTYLASDAVPSLLSRQTTRDVEALTGEEPGEAALRVAQDVGDLRLRYESLRAVDLDRFDLWARQSGIDAEEGDAGAVAGDVTSMELTWQRLRDDSAAARHVTATLTEAREAADRKDMGTAERLAAELSAAIAEVR
ncbi:hypothetical protein STRCI_002717 [Streptomyces cinnabarinus]|uniref:Lipoprotein n=1 Tax=Streptomyces cinnabarinus TaxID=67287 RepID=A0ABY7KAN2_9ACTN|nr:hypothetical protein [Streptomyces cinnabarinus]WAZ21538.1 hypothetical protein STRCI_002717 [Streptomyces cinnabarinus]